MNKNSTSRNTALNTAGTFIYFFFQWLTTVLVVRLTNNSYSTAGVFSLIVSFSNVFGFISRYGIRNYQLSDNVNEYSISQYSGSYLTACAASFTLFIIALPFCGYSTHVIICCFAYMLYKFVETLAFYFFTIMQKQNRYDAIAISNTLKGLLPLLGFSGVLIINKDGLFWAIIAMTAIFLFTILFYDIPIIKKESKIGISFKGIMPIMKKCFPLMLSTLIVPYMTFIVRFVIEKLYGKELLGYYSSISMVVVIMTTLGGSIWVVLLPGISKNYAMGKYAELKKQFLIILSGITAVTFVAVIFGKLFGSFAFSLIFGKEITEYIYLLTPVIIASGLLTATAFFMSVLIPMRKRTSMLLCAASGAVVLTAIVYFMTKEYKLNGANYALIIGLTVQLVALCIPTFKALKSK